MARTNPHATKKDATKRPFDAFKDLDKRSRLALRQAFQDGSSAGAAPAEVVRKLESKNLVARSGHTHTSMEWGKAVRRWPVFWLTDEGKKVAEEIVDRLYGSVTETSQPQHSTIKTPKQLDVEIAEALATVPTQIPTARPMRRQGKRILRVFRRVEPGRYYAEAGSHTWHVFRVRSDYGDLQWILDRDDHPGYAQCSTLYCVRSAIITATRDELRATSPG